MSNLKNIPEDFLIPKVDSKTLTGNNPNVVIKKFETALLERNFTNSIFFGLDLSLSGHPEKIYEKLLDIFLKDYNISSLFYLEWLYNEVKSYFHKKKIYKKDISDLGNNQEFRNHSIFNIGYLIMSKKSDLKLFTDILSQNGKQILSVDPTVKIYKFQTLILDGNFNSEVQKSILTLVYSLYIQHTDAFYKQIGSNKPCYIDILWDIVLRNTLKITNNVKYKRLALILYYLYNKLGKNINCLLLIVYLYMNPSYCNYQNNFNLDHGSLGRITEESLKVNYFINQKILKLTN